jgi:predicted Zn-dependent peptidase
MTSTTSAVRDIEITHLPNGVRVITEAMPHVRSVSVGIWIGSGSRRETGDHNGISHFIEHMLFKGTTRRSAEDIARSVDSIGGNLDAFTAKELVCFNTKVLDEHLSQAFDVLADLVLHPLFREEDIEKEKGVILEEIKMEADSPDYLVHEIFSSNFWKDHPLGKPILGTPQTVKRFDQEMIRSFYNAVYAPSNLIVTAAGNLTHGRLVELAREHLADLEPGSPCATRKPSSRSISASACRRTRCRTRSGLRATCSTHFSAVA